MIELSATKTTTLGFKLDTEGNSETPLVRFCVKVGEDFLVGFHAQTFKDKAIVNVPPLSFISEYRVESFETFLEVIVNGSYFIPWKGTSTLKTPVNVQANFAVSKEEPEVTAEVDTTIRYEETEHKSKVNKILKEEESAIEETPSKPESFSDFIKKKGIK